MRVPSNFYRLLFVLCIGCGLIFIYQSIARSFPNQSQRYGRHPSREAHKVILLRTEFFGDKKWGLPDLTVGEKYFRDAKCPVTNCIVTADKDYLPALQLYDALVFHTAEQWPFLKRFLRQRRTEQVYIFAQLESPAETKNYLGGDGSFYNWTMTYRLDSDVVWPYRYVEDSEIGQIVAPKADARWRMPPTFFYDDDLWDRIKNKDRLGAWFVSHCNVLSARDQLVKSLQQFVDVDVFGRCGNFSCPRGSPECDDLLDRKYKFYFSLENSLCTDYVTEKFFNALERYIVPVVFGGVDYSRFAPPGSYINAEDFETTKDLADHLLWLDKNPKEYMKYFWWKQYYRIVDRSPFCALCEKLNEKNTKTVQNVYRNIEEWWFGNSCYFKPKIKFVSKEEK